MVLHWIPFIICLRWHFFFFADGRNLSLVICKLLLIIIIYVIYAVVAHNCLVVLVSNYLVVKEIKIQLMKKSIAYDEKQFLVVRF